MGFLIFMAVLNFVFLFVFACFFAATYTTLKERLEAFSSAEAKYQMNQVFNQANRDMRRAAQTQPKHLKQ